MNLLVKDVPDEIQHEFRIACAVEGKSIRETVLNFLTERAETVRSLTRKASK